jgi:hypothetical protein
MKVISTRSPFIIVVGDATAIASKVELFVWNKGTAMPTFPTYVMSENIPSVTQLEMTYNISPFLTEYINQIEPNKASTTVTVESNSNWVYCFAKAYFTANGTTFTLFSEELYVCLNSFTNPDSGVNFDISNFQYVLLTPDDKIKITTYTNFAIPYYNFVCERDSVNSYIVRYYDATGSVINAQTILTAGAIEEYNYRIPLAYGSTSVQMKIFLGTDLIHEVDCELLLECKYTPNNVDYINSYGGWQSLVFFKASQNSIDIKSTDYNVIQPSYNYNPKVGQSKTMNTNGQQTVKCNTGWVDENYNLLIRDLLLSETVLLNGKPVIVKSKQISYKTYLKDKNINYTIDFEYSNNIINNIV